MDPTDLFEWRPPAEFAEAVDRYLEPLRHAEVIREPPKHLREAFALGRFACIARAEAVKLHSGEEFDGWVRHELSLTLPVEITEAYEPGRKRDDELRIGQPARYESAERMAHVENSFMDWVQKSFEKKAIKTYPAGTMLLIYTGVSPYFPAKGQSQRVFLQERMDSVPGVGPFSSVAVLISGAIMWRQADEKLIYIDPEHSD